MVDLDIEYNLQNYVGRIEQQIEIGKFVTTESEDFFLRVFSNVYDLRKLQNLNYVKPNIKAIDLIDRDEKLGIQITAQKSKELKKIEHTINGTIEYWKNQGINKLWVFFISETDVIKKIDTSIEYCSREGISVWIKTVKKVIGDINAKRKEERIRIDELIKQETSPEYYGLSKLTLFNQVEKGQKIVSDNFFNLEDTIYYSKTELKTINYLSEKFNAGRLKEYCILGNPCSGKTTFAYSVIQRMTRRKVFYLNLSNPAIVVNQITEELIQISHNHALVIVDNIHENVELFKDIRNRIVKHKTINALYLSRYYKTFDDFNEENIYRIIDGIKFFRIDTNENFEEKVSGIIWKKTKQLRKRNQSISWRKGNYSHIIRNINRNLLKLNIGLRVWEQKNSLTNPITFDKIDSNKILQHFYIEHKLHKLKTDILYTYCLLFKNDIPFVPIRNELEVNMELREKGIILQYFKSDFCFFSHKEYAKLIYDSFAYIDNGISAEKKASLILNYIFMFDTSENRLDLIYLVTKFYYSDDKEAIPFLLNDHNLVKHLLGVLGEANLRNYQINTILNIVFEFSAEISESHLTRYFQSFLLFFKTNKLNLYIYEHYMAYTRLLQISNELDSELPLNHISVVLRENEKANTNSVVELTYRISRKNRASDTVLRILNSFTYPEWLSMLTNLPRLPNITNSLSELNTSSEAKKLLRGLMRNIDWDSQFKNSKSLKIDQFAKSIRELQKVDTSVGSNISMFLFNKAISESFISSKLESANLSEYAKALSDISNINPEFVKIQLQSDFDNNSLKVKFAREKSISNFTARALELKKHFADSNVFFSLINSIVSSGIFQEKIANEKNLNHLLIFNEFCDKFLSNINSQLHSINNRAINNLLKKLTDKFEALTNPKFLSFGSIDSEFIDSITSKDIEDFLKKNKVTYAENLFRVLSSSNKTKTIELFNDIKNSSVVNLLLDPELNLSQSLEVLYKIRNKLHKNSVVNCNLKISQILNTYLRIYRTTENRYSRISISDFFIGFYFGYKIDPLIIERYCKDDLEKKLRNSQHRGFEISSLFQFTRRISEITNNTIDKELGNFLDINTANFIETIKNEDIVKTLSGLSELGLSPFAMYADNLLYKAKALIIRKVKQRRNEEIFNVKLIPDIEKIAKDKGKIVLKELKG